MYFGMGRQDEQRNKKKKRKTKKQEECARFFYGLIKYSITRKMF